MCYPCAQPGYCHCPSPASCPVPASADGSGEKRGLASPKGHREAGFKGEGSVRTHRGGIPHRDSRRRNESHGDTKTATASHRQQPVAQPQTETQSEPRDREMRTETQAATEQMRRGLQREKGSQAASKWQPRRPANPEQESNRSLGSSPGRAARTRPGERPGSSRPRGTRAGGAAGGRRDARYLRATGAAPSPRPPRPRAKRIGLRGPPALSALPAKPKYLA